jgi:hypothetical protein
MPDQTPLFTFSLYKSIYYADDGVNCSVLAEVSLPQFFRPDVTVVTIPMLTLAELPQYWTDFTVARQLM